MKTEALSSGYPGCPPIKGSSRNCFFARFDYRLQNRNRDRACIARDVPLAFAIFVEDVIEY